MPTILATIKVRGDTEANWSSVNPILAYKELGLATDTRKLKAGDGVTAWNSLPFLNAAAVDASDVAFTPAGNIDADDVQDAIEELDDEKAALAGAAFSGNVTTSASLGVGNSDFTDALSGTAKVKFQDGANFFVSIRDNAGQGWLGLTNGSIRAYLGQTHTAQGYAFGSHSAHGVALRVGNSTKLAADTSGNVGISNYALAAIPAIGFKLWVNGTLGTTGNCTLGDASTDAHTANGSLAATTWLKSGSYTVATVPSAATAGAGAQIYVTDESGGATGAQSDGTNWRRFADRAIIS